MGGARTGAMETRGPRMIKHDFSPHFSANNMYKDLFQAMKLADEVGAFLPATGISLEMLRAVKNQGKGELDSCASSRYRGDGEYGGQNRGIKP